MREWIRAASSEEKWSVKWHKIFINWTFDKFYWKFLYLADWLMVKPSVVLHNVRQIVRFSGWNCTFFHSMWHVSCLRLHFLQCAESQNDRLKPGCLIFAPNLWMQSWQKSSLPVSLLSMQWNHLQISWHWKIEGIETLPKLRTWERDQHSYKLAAKMVSFINIWNKTTNGKNILLLIDTPVDNIIW